MQPKYDLDNLIRKQQAKDNTPRFPGDDMKIREGVFVSLQKKRPGARCPGDSARVNEYIEVSLQNK